MANNRMAKSLAVAAQFIIFMAAPALTRAETPAPQILKPSASAPIQGDPYAEAFAGLNYTDKQKEAISKIKEEIASRKAVVQNSGQLNTDQKDAMLTGYTRMEYSQIYNVLTPEQKKQVSTRWRARRAAEKAAQKAQAPNQ